jgi:hypothetical protein
VAIKGKGRTRSRRVVAAPPRPQLVVRKPPLWRRPIVLGVVAIVGVAAILFAVFATLSSNSRKRLEDREAVAIGQLADQFVKQFPADRQAIPPDSYFFYPTLPDDLKQLSEGKLAEKDLEDKAKKLLDSATIAATGLGKVNVNKLIPTTFTVSRVAGASGRGLTRQELTDARFLMQRSFTLYGSVATVMKAAGEAEGTNRAALVDDAAKMTTEATELFTQGWQILVRLAGRVGIQAPVS